MKKSSFKLLPLLPVLFALGCASNEPKLGPDKQGRGMVMGALVGAGTGAVTGAQVSSATGPGAAVGAGLGAIAGGIRGLSQDAIEEDLMQLNSQARDEAERARAHSIILEHYKKRLELHPARDIYPADIFFDGDLFEIKPDANFLVEEIIRLNLYRYPWSRFVITSYVRSADPESEYAKDLAKRRADSLGNVFVKAGMNPRRIEARAVVMPAPILIDPYDDKDRYSEAIEFIPIDR